MGKNRGILKDVYYEAWAKYCEKHGGQSGASVSQCWVSFEGRDYNIVFARYGDNVMVSIHE